MKAKVKNLILRTKDIFSLDLSLDLKLNAKPGQFVLIKLEGYPQRAYSIVCEKDNIITLGIKIQGLTSKALSQLNKGDILEVLGPFGSFLPRNAKKAVLVGGGIGITPLPSLYHYYKSNDIDVDVLLSSQGDFVFLEYFDTPKLFDTVTGRRINENDIASDSLVYICGPKKMISSLREKLVKKGHNPEHIFSEDFV